MSDEHAAGFHFMEALPVLQVAVPLMAAPICVLLRNPVLVRVFAIAVGWFCLGNAALMLGSVSPAWGALLGVAHLAPHGVLDYTLGGWSAPVGIALRVDLVNAFVALIVAAIAAVVLPFGLGQDTLTVPRERSHLFYAAFLLCMAGLFGITVTGDAFNVFVFLEVTSLSSYTLISLGRGRQALRAAFSYLIMGTIGGTFILLGIGFAYQMTGTLNMADMAERLPAVMDRRPVHVGFAFFFIGSAIKLAVFPLHQWLPNAYTYAPAAVSAFLSATATKVTYYILARTIFTIYGAAYVFGFLHLDMLLAPLSLAAMFIGSLAAIYQRDLKRLLAYSSIAQIGYMTLGLSMNNVDGLTGGIVHLFNHAMMKGGMFLVVACIVFRIGSQQIDDMRGLGRRMPFTGLAFVMGGLSLIGVPGTVGFVSKWYLVMGALERGWVLAAGLILLSSLLAVVYVWRVVELFYFARPREGATLGRPAPASMLIPTWILIGACVYFGLNTDLTAEVAVQAATQLLGSHQ